MPIMESQTSGQSVGQVVIHNASLSINIAGWRRIVGGLFVAAFMIRLAFVLTLQDGFYFYDSVDYTASALNLVTHGEFGEAYRRPPAYPVFLAGIYSLFGQTILAIRLVESLLGACLAMVVAVIGRCIAGEGVGALAGFLWAVFPNAIFIAGLVYPTGLATMLLACAVLCLVTEAGKLLAPGRAMLGGLFVGFAALTVPVALLTAGALALWVLYWQHTRRLLLAALVLLGVALALAPWTARNYKVHGRFVLIEPRLVQRVPAIEVPQEDAAAATQNGDKVGAILKTPGAFARRYVKEFANFWELSPKRVAMSQQAFREYLHAKDARIVRTTVFGTSLASLVSILSVGPMFLFALIGGVAMSFQRERRRHLSLLCSVILSFAVGYAFFFGKMRYRIPVEPYIVLLGAYGLGMIWLALASGKPVVVSPWIGRYKRPT